MRKGYSMKVVNFVFTVLLVSLVMFSVASAGENTELEEKIAAGDIIESLEEIVVSASRTEVPVYRTPAHVTVITRTEIESSTAKNVPDLLISEAGTIVYDFYGSGSTTTIDFRGFNKGSNTLVLIDGVRFNEVDSSSTDWALIPLDNIERIEIVRGSMSALYGDNAMGGVINIITRKPTGPSNINLKLESGSWEYNRQVLEWNAYSDDLQMNITAAHRKIEGYRENSGFEATDLSGNLRFGDIINKFGIKLDYHEDERGLAGGLDPETAKDNPRKSDNPYDGSSYNQKRLAFFYNSDLGGDFSFDTTIYGNSREWHSEFLDDFGGAFNAVSDTTTFGANAKIKFEREVSDKVYIGQFGVDYSKSRIDSSSVFNSPFYSSDSLAEATRDVIGVFLTGEYPITEKLILNAGVRSDEGDFGYKGDDSYSGITRGNNTEGSVSPKVGLVYRFSDVSSIYTNYSQSFRFPNLDEMFGFFGISPELKSEESDTIEVGVKHRFTRGLSGTLAFYNMQVDNEIYYNPFGGDFGFGQNENYDETIHRGVEMSLEWWASSDLRIKSALTWLTAEFANGENDGKTLPLIPETKAAVQGTWYMNESWILALAGNYIGEQYLVNDIQNQLDKLDSYFTLDGKIAYTHDNWEAFLNINNLTNEDYDSYGAVGSAGNIEVYPGLETNLGGGFRYMFR
jgi:iron complex outermembrane recepter protein